MSLISATAFFTIGWSRPINAGLLPSAQAMPQQLMTIAWQPVLSTVFYPFEKTIDAAHKGNDKGW